MTMSYLGDLCRGAALAARVGLDGVRSAGATTAARLAAREAALPHAPFRRAKSAAPVGSCSA